MDETIELWIVGGNGAPTATRWNPISGAKWYHFYTSEARATQVYSEAKSSEKYIAKVELAKSHAIDLITD